jgi:hypothetical protein
MKTSEIPSYELQGKPKHRYWVNFSRKRLQEKFLSKYGDNFNIIIRDSGDETNYYKIPYPVVKHLFKDDYLSNDIHNSKRWVANIIDGCFKIATNPEKVNVKKYFSILNLQEKSVKEPEDEFEEEVEKARKLTQEERLNMIKNHPEQPSISKREVKVFNRNPYVVAEVLERSNGKCEHCKSDAPFKKVKNGMPFLEVHHKELLSEDGKDTLENAIALCPNCHRGFHYGGFQLNINN